MIQLAEDDKKTEARWGQPGTSASEQAFASSSNANANASPPPAFDDNLAARGSSETDHLLVDLNAPPTDAHAELGPPPDFTPYEAENFTVGYDDVVSHDPHLNSDGEALYRFLLSQAQSPPSHRLNCRGTHSESRQRWVTERDANGRSRSRQEHYTETVTDFDFCIDIVPTAPVEHVTTWSVADDEPAYRGRMVREYEGEGEAGTGAGGRRKAGRREVGRYKEWVERRRGLGYPPWVREADVVDGVVLADADGLRSSKTLRQWADEYCASPKKLKEFVYEKVLYGWNMQQLESAVRSTIEATPYSGTLTLTSTPYNSKIHIRPSNTLSRLLSNKWLRLLSILLLLFPFIWLFKRFHARGGGRWEVCGGAYALKRWVPLEPGEEAEAEAVLQESEELPPYGYDPRAVGLGMGGSGSALTRTIGSRGSRGSQRSARYMQTATGPKKLVGLKEGEWFRSWEGVITRAVMGGYQSSVPLPSRDRSGLPVRSLDGYDESLIEY